MVHSHLAFDVLTSATFQAEDLDGYQVLLMPNMEFISDSDEAIFPYIVPVLGTLVVSGPNPTGRNEYGDPRPEYALTDVLGLSLRAALPPNKQNAVGAGQAYYFSDLLGRQYLNQTLPTARERLLGVLTRHAPPF